MVLETGWEDRTRQKMVAAVLLSGCGSIISARRQYISIWQNLPVHIMGYSGIMGLFTAIQEVLRGLRKRHDALNSLAAGTFAGSLAAGYFQGPRYRLLGALVWGPLCSMVHVLNDAAKPRHVLEDWLVGEGLLNPIVAERRRHGGAVDDAYRQATSGWSSVSPSIQQEAEKIRKREMALLMVQRAQQAQQATGSQSAAGLALRDSSSSSSNGDSSRRLGDGSGTTHASSREAPKRGWWAWVTGRGKRRDGSAQGAVVQGRLHDAGRMQSLSQTEHVTRRDHAGDSSKRNPVGTEEDAADEADFQKWLATQIISQEGLVVPGSS